MPEWPEVEACLWGWREGTVEKAYAVNTADPDLIPGTPTPVRSDCLEDRARWESDLGITGDRLIESQMF